MAYNDNEYSVKAARPQEAYLFDSGSEEWRLTSFDREVTVNGETYTPAPMTRSEPEAGEDSMKSDLTITIAANSDMVSDMLQSLVEQPVIVTIYRKHWDDATWLTYWKGRLVNFTPGAETELQCESVFTSMRRPGLRAKYQRLCRHALYSVGEGLLSLCEVEMADYAVAAKISSAENVPTIETDLTGYDSSYFKGGFLRQGSYMYRFIYSVSGGGRYLTLDRPLDLAVGTDITLYPGCNHTYSTCRDKFNNSINFGGFPWVPNKNPFTNLTGGF